MNTRELVYNFITEYIDEHGYAPSHTEIGKAVGLKSKSSVNSHIKRLFKDGLIETDIKENKYVPRAFRIARKEVV